MSWKPNFTRPFNMYNDKRSEILLKSPWQDIYDFYWSLWDKLSLKKSHLLIYKILGLLVHTLTTDDKHCPLSRDNLTQPIQIQKSKKQKLFSNSFSAFLKPCSNFKQFQKKITLKAYIFLSLRTAKTCSDKFLKGPVSQDLAKRNKVNDVKHCCKLRNSTLIIFIDHCESNWVRKSLS